MQTLSTNAAEIPTALPDIEADEDRENLLLENQPDEPEDEEVDSDELAHEADSGLRGSRTGKVLKSFAAFTVFLFLMGVAITWFFGMGFFATQKPQSVNRTGGKDTSSAPMTEDEKLKAALTMVASKEPSISKDSIANQPSEIMTVEEKPEPNAGQPGDIVSMTDSRSGGSPPTNIGTTISSQESNGPRDETSETRNKDDRPRVNGPQLTQPNTSIEPVGRSLFFGITKARNDATPVQNASSGNLATDPKKAKSSGQIPFGTLLPVRLIGAIYTLRSSGGVVRMELTQPIEGKGYSFPAGTMLIGNLRGGESVRAFVSVVGLIDPASGELVKFSGELMGTDGASGIKGNRKRITGKWTRFFRGLKETAGSILGSVGSFRSGGAIVLSEPLRRGSERLSEDTSESLFGTEREDTFLEVLAGTSGYVLVTQLPEPTTSMTATATGADKE
ncbi:MAG: hypothetical protein IPQ00_03120 [Chloracidobacterium sp.]|nr:hypothetical protein [Chloracidobacterium sp.]